MSGWSQPKGSQDSHGFGDVGGQGSARMEVLIDNAGSKTISRVGRVLFVVVKVPADMF